MRVVLCAVAVAVALLGCDDDPVDPEPVGSLQAEVVTTGENTDADGYSVEIDDGAAVVSLEVNDTTTVSLEVGDHDVLLSDVAENCVVDGENPRTATITEDATTVVSFSVSCS